MNSQLTPHDWELLSLYLDGQLADSRRRQAQDLIALRPEMKHALEELRRTRAVLRAAPRRRAPRNFTLSAAIASQARPRLRWAWALSFRFASAMAAVLLVFSFFFRLPVTLPAATQPMAVSSPAASAPENFGAAPPIIIWNDSYRAGDVMGMGSGPNEANEKLNPSQLAPDAPIAPVQPDGPATIMAVTPEPGSKAALPTVAAAVDATGSGPILGVAPAQERGKILTQGEGMAVQPAASRLDGWVYVQAALAGAVLLFAMAAWLTWRMARR